MRKRAYKTGNCPECGFCITCVGDAKTPKHGHVKYWYAKGKWRWLPSCIGSGKPAIWVQTVGKGGG